MTDATERAVIVERLRALIAEQKVLMQPLVPEAQTWEALGLDAKTGLMLAAADRPEEWERIRQLGDAMLAALHELEAADASGPGPERDMVARVRWALGKPEDRR